jgi:hypothetical protein
MVDLILNADFQKQDGIQHDRLSNGSMLAPGEIRRSMDALKEVKPVEHGDKDETDKEMRKSSSFTTKPKEAKDTLVEVGTQGRGYTHSLKSSNAKDGTEKDNITDNQQSRPSSPKLARPREPEGIRI